MNLFKRARSTTSRGTGANDQSPQSSSRAQATGSDTSGSRVPGLGPLGFPYGTQGSSNYASNPALSRKITYRTHEEPICLFEPSAESITGLTHPPRKPARSAINTYDNNPDLYARNNLDTFVFGAGPPPSGSRLSPIDPNFILDEQDSEDTHLADTTPRPSVIANVPLKQRLDNSTPSATSAYRNEGFSGVVHPGYQGDRRSAHTFGGSSASASASSLVGPSDSSTGHLSRASSHSSSTPHTGNDFTSTSSDDEDMDHVHPLSSDVDDVPWQPNRQRAASPLFLSDDELDIYEDEGENEVDATRRKGSLAIPIVNTASGSVVSLRRGSRSLDELHSASFARPSSSSLSRTSGGTTIPAPASSSVPQSEYEIENVRKKSLPPIAPAAAEPNEKPPLPDNAIDLSWMENFGRTGIVGFNNDDMADIVGSNDSPSMDREPTSNIRRHSTFSTTTVDIMLKNIQAWNSSSQKYQDQRKLWIFDKEDCDLVVSPRRPSISYFFSSRSNTMTDASLLVPFFDHGHIHREKERKLHRESWKGMGLGAEEYWTNGWSGRFRVSRRNTSSNPETLQQRLIFSYTRNQDGHDRTATDKPTVTIHKHSKTVAFSISRTYRQKNPSKSSNSNADRLQPTTTQALVEKKKLPILLAPRRVQVAYTSTTTTRKLESHGLLNDDGRKNTKDIERLERIRKEREREERRREKEREKVKGKERERGVMERAAKTFSTKGKESDKSVLVDVKSFSEGQKERVKPAEFTSTGDPGPNTLMHVESQFTNGDRSRGSKVTYATSSNTSTVTTPDLGEETASSVDQTLVESMISDRTLGVVPSFFRRRDSAVDNEDPDDDDDDSFDSHRRLPHRSTYRETYATLPPEVFESNQHENTHRFFGWAKPKSDRVGPRNYLEASYNPPWLTQPKHSSITRKDIVEDLNMSFQDVGLLPAIGEFKSASSKGKRKKNKKTKPPALGHENHVDLFAQLPDDVLYMILPLWPGETDAASAKRSPFTSPPIPVEKRLYLLVYYKAMPSPNHQDDRYKKRSRTTPDVQDDRFVFLNSFHISARIVSYHDLQGSSIRIPDYGLAVCGPLEEAYSTMPTIQPSDSCIIGLCSSRDAGFEFMPDGFEKMGLSHHVPNPRLMESLTTDDDTSSMDTLVVPTPIGHAVMEMAWFGGMALSGFHRDPQWRG